MQNNFFKIAFFSASVFLLSCSQENKDKEANTNRVFPEYHYALDSVIKSPNGIIGGIELGQSENQIPALEIAKAIEKTNNHITYEQKIDSVSQYSITYVLDNDTISEIDIHITSTNSDFGDTVINDLKKYYQLKYTAPMMDKGYFVFNCFDSNKRNFTITLTDNSSPSNSVIDMSVYREK